MLDSGVLGYWKDDWSRDSTQTWGYEQFCDYRYGTQDHNFLGSCAKDFRPHNKLMFKAVVPSGNESSLELLFDHLEICNLSVTFGNNYPNQTGSSRWEWSENWGDDGRQDGAWTKSRGTFIPEGGEEAETDWLLLKRV